jgi:hypothetical membrane protein
LLAPAVTLGCIVAATLLAPWFSWTGDALSTLGVRRGTALLFNGGLVAGSLLALPFAGALWRSARTVGERVAAVGFALAAATMGLVGVFPASHPFHVPAAVGFYALSTATFVADGAARRGTAAGATALGLAVVHATTWVAWGAGVRPGPGLALPEIVGAGLLALWVWVVSPAAPVRVRVGVGTERGG